MKKIQLIITLLLYTFGLWSQTVKDPANVKSVLVSQAINTTSSNEEDILFTVQVGAPFFPGNDARVSKTVDIRFPWDVLYSIDTFNEDFFFISKGYFNDRITIKWNLKNNTIFNQFKLFRRKVQDSNIDDIVNYGTPIATLAKDIREYVDTDISGSILYEYKLTITGGNVSATATKYVNYITGIGIKNPTATVSGNISFKGSQPVEGVVVEAERGSGAPVSGPALSVPSTGSVSVKTKEKNITNKLTFQAWTKPLDNQWSSASKFKLVEFYNAFRTNSITIHKENGELQVDVDGAIFKLRNYFPAGTKDNRGDDVMQSINEFHEDFVHFSVIMEHDSIPKLYINGRPITEEYKTEINKILVFNGFPSNFEITLPTATNTLIDESSATDGEVLNNMLIGSGKAYFIDEVRVWNTTLSTYTILQDYSRYISGEEYGLVSYLRANEGVGRFAYDLSRSGREFNEAHGVLYRPGQNPATMTTWSVGDEERPKTSQLGVFGITDQNGNYTISSIPYDTQVNYLFTPMFGQHKFEPNFVQKTIGASAAIINDLNFTDISSFSFKGVVLYDTRGVFPAYDDVAITLEEKNSATVQGGARILDEGYNYYEINGERFTKGSHWLNKGADDSTLLKAGDDYLDKYAKVFLEGAEIYIDNQIVIDDESGGLKRTGVDGKFDVQVPIGNHSIKIKKEGHTFAYGGRFPAEDTKEFFEDSEEYVTFIDLTRVEVVGKVVGGPVEGAKVVGFGDQGLHKQQVYDTDATPPALVLKTVSSINNIGTAKITLGYKPPGDGQVTTKTKTTFLTNLESGEYRISLLPIQYNLDQYDLVVLGKEAGTNGQRESVEVLDASKTLNFLDANKSKTTPEFTYKKLENGITTDGKLEGTPYHYAKNFVYRSTPVVRVVGQTSDAHIGVIHKDSKGEFSPNKLQVPLTDPEIRIYTQFAPYTITLERIESYINYDDLSLDPIETKVPAIDGKLIITNNLDYGSGSTPENTVPDPSNINQEIYTFNANKANLTPPFTTKSTLKYRVNEKDYAVEGFQDTGIVIGYVQVGERAFLTDAPEDMPEIILRDPPGTESYATIEIGTQIVVKEKIQEEYGAIASLGIRRKNGVNVQTVTGGGLIGPGLITELRVLDGFNAEFEMSLSGSTDNTLEKTYTFTKKISTHNEGTHVGGNADLFIGHSSNYFYTPISELFASKHIPVDVPFETIVVGSNTFYLYAGDNYAIEPDTPATTFVYSQRFLIDQLIPEYEAIIAGIKNGNLIPGGTTTTVGSSGTPVATNILEIADYEAKIFKWRKILLDNEITKYLVKNYTEEYKQIVLENIENKKNQAYQALRATSKDPSIPMKPGISTKEEERILSFGENLKNTLEKNYQTNYSFDSGSAGITNSIETFTLYTRARAFIKSFSEKFTHQRGVEFRGKGLMGTTVVNPFQKHNVINIDETRESTKFTYHLQDIDKGNSLSVDVINVFDGYGPIFITQAGKTSCPFEDTTVSKFITEDVFKTYADTFLDLTFNLGKREKAILVLQDEVLDLEREIEINKLLIFDTNTIINEAKKEIEELSNNPSELIRLQEIVERREAQIATLQAELDIKEPELTAKQAELTAKQAILALDNGELQKLNNNFYARIDPAITTTLPTADLARLNYGTEKVSTRTIEVLDASVADVPSEGQAEFELTLTNKSPSGPAALDWYSLEINNATNPDGATFNISSFGNQLIQLKHEVPTKFTLTMKKGAKNVFEYDSIEIRIVQLCDYWMRQEIPSVFVSAKFKESCSKVALTSPTQNWVYNKEKAYRLETNADGVVERTTKPLPIRISEFDSEFDNFQKIDLEYRLASTPNYITLKTYYKGVERSQPANVADYNEYEKAKYLQQESDIEAIGANTIIPFAFDIAGLGLSNGAYELRARTTCLNSTEYISETLTGIVDLTSPVLFATPTPIDGILGSGEDFLVHFNEHIFYNSAVSEVEIKGMTNQLEIDHSVSLKFNGATNKAVVTKMTKVPGSDFSMEFWLKNETTATTATIPIINQNNGLQIGLENNEIYFQLTANSPKVKGGLLKEIGDEEVLFHHYTFTYNATSGTAFIYADDKTLVEEIIGTGLQVLGKEFTIGGTSFIGNIHDLRLWNKYLTSSEAYANMYTPLRGSESYLLGYWPFNKGRGSLAEDLSRFKHASLNNEGMWDIKPKGDSYEFKNGQYLKLDALSDLIITEEMDATMSFWMKADGTSNGSTLFSNGNGSGSDGKFNPLNPEDQKVPGYEPPNDNGFRNKWVIRTNGEGKLVLKCEGRAYGLTELPVTDNAWHHVALLFNRRGNLKTYIDAELSTIHSMEKIGGFFGNKMVFGGKMHINSAGELEVSNEFTGKLDEFRVWNTLRNVEQIKRDRFFEVDHESIGLLLYLNMNERINEIGAGITTLRYHKYEYPSKTLVPVDAEIGGGGSLSYSTDTPAIKPNRRVIKFGTTVVTNEDQMIIIPELTNWAAVEGQVLDITVHRMFDAANNEQQSPVTWTAYVNRHEVSWFVEGHDDVVDIIHNKGEDTTTFDISLVNRGGTAQNYSITDVPTWLTLDGENEVSGVLAPNGTRTITATVNDNVNVGDYLENLSLDTGYGFIEKLSIKLKVLAPAPDWSFKDIDFRNTMNIVARIKIDNIISEDIHDKVAVFHGDEIMGVGSLEQNPNSKEYLMYLTIYDGRKETKRREFMLDFKIWDASRGEVLEAEFNSGNGPVLDINYITRAVRGTSDAPATFRNTQNVEQIIPLKEGWTWVSFNVRDENFKDVNKLMKNLDLTRGDRILTDGPFMFIRYERNGKWKWRTTKGDKVTSGSFKPKKLSANSSYKINMAKRQTLTVKGSRFNLNNFEITINEGWNWIAYPVETTETVNEALSNYNASVGDLIKGHTGFSQYGKRGKWEGNLEYLEPGKGYLMRSIATTSKPLKYPAYFAASKSKNNKAMQQEQIAATFTKYSQNMNAIVLLPEGYSKLYAYDDQGVLKGSSKGQLIDGEILGFITLYGEGPENLTFHIGSDAKENKTSKVIDFIGDTVLGTISEPILLELDELDAVHVFPNPFGDTLTVSVTVSSDQTVELNLYSILNQKVITKKFNAKQGKNVFDLKTSRIPSGVYLLKISKNENSIAYKVIKK